MAELIDRQAAINAVKVIEPLDGVAIDGREVLSCLCQQPTVEERKHGEWIIHNSDVFPTESTMECNQCHAEQPVWMTDDNFYPNCGADMRGDNNG